MARVNKQRKTARLTRREGLVIVQAPGWVEAAAQHPWLRHGFSTRTGGVSRAYRPELAPDAGELNLSWTKEDDPVLVAENRRRFIAALAGKRAAKKATLVTLRQIHSGVVHVIRDAAARLATEDGRAVLHGDGVMTDVPGLLLGIQTADCVPVLVADRKRRAVAGFHAGWRGTAARIVERGVGRMRLEYGSRPQDLIAAIGPGIGPCCYAVGEEVVQQFMSQFAYYAELFREVYDSDPIREKYPMLFLTARAPGHSNLGPQRHLDLWEANRRQLLDAGLKEKNITVTAECTACKLDRYFSHRAEHGFTGRMLNVIGVVE
ncbi:MAG: peptidoglycan editing factor PgeF [Acidobacteriaceae bacterium]